MTKSSLELQTARDSAEDKLVQLLSSRHLGDGFDAKNAEAVASGIQAIVAALPVLDQAIMRATVAEIQHKFEGADTPGSPSGDDLQ